MTTSESKPVTRRQAEADRTGAHRAGDGGGVRTAEPAERRRGAPSPEELRADIERTRAEIGDIVEALAAKADVKARVKDKIGRVRGNLAGKAQRISAPQARSTAAVVIGAGAVTAGTWMWRRRRAARRARARARAAAVALALTRPVLTSAAARNPWVRGVAAASVGVMAIRRMRRRRRVHRMVVAPK